LVEKIRKATTLPLHLHSHDTSGMAVATNIKAIEAGIDIIDSAISSFANGTSQPPTEVLVNVLRGGPSDPGLDLNLLAEIAEYFREVRKKYKKYESDFTGVDPNVLIYQIPGGMTSNLASQLNEQKALGKMKEVLDEVPRVRADLGYPPLVTPASQIVGTQATLNVLTGERYKVITTETRNFLKGLYGTPPAPMNESVRKRAVGDEEIITRRPADLLEPELEKSREELKDRTKSVEDLVSYTLFPKIALEFFTAREQGKLNKPPDDTPKPDPVSSPAPVLAPSEFNIKVHGETYHVKVGGMGHQGEGGRPYFIYIDDQLEEVMVESLVEIVPSEEGRIDKQVGGRSIRPKASQPGDVTAAMPGTVMKVKVRPGDKVKTGETVLIVEAMKMENEVHSPIDGEVKAVYVAEGDKINPDELLVMVRE
ncbi:MAG TPA: pyruvate carboxylase subunit B, partial [Nitrospiria bacterium]|nr:pyruvate carboxylase subunit B [Nitrospiria bacterium]